MVNLVSLVLFFAAGFAVAFTIAWLIVTGAQSLRKQPNPPIGHVVRIRAASGMYRSHVVNLGKSTWTISAPIQRDNYVPLRVGEEVVIESATSNGALIFRSKVVARQSDTHVLVISRPDRVHSVDRRKLRRWPHLVGSDVKIEGTVGTLLDLSEGGARVQTAYATHKGDRVRLDLPSGDAIFAWVLSQDGSEARLRFEELMEFSQSKTETAPAY